ncbi:MAG: branched-chain amino acid ABC transporter permease [Fervidicoccaceae archaeon]
MPLESFQLLLTIASMTFIYLIVVTSLNLEAGFLGLPNFGKMLAVISGALFTAWFSPRMGVLLYNLAHPGSQIYVTDYVVQSNSIVTTLNPWLAGSPFSAALLFLITISLSSLVGGLIGLISVIPSVRLREDYLGITLLAMAETARVIGYNYEPIAGGTSGVQIPDPLFGFGDSRYLYYVAILAPISAAVFLLYRRMQNSPFGRALKSIRENEDAASSLGKDIVKSRAVTIFIGSATAALAGSLYAYYTLGVIATAYDRFSWTFWPWVMMMLGGMGTNLGPLVGAFTFVTARTLIYTYKQMLSSFLPFNVVWLDYLLLSLSIIFILLIKPNGLIKERPLIFFKVIERKGDASKEKA